MKENKVVVMLRGLIASGKSTIAKELVETRGYKRVNKDELRAMIDNSKWSKENEKQIIEVRDLIIINYLDAGYNVVVDDTNFAPEHEASLREIALHCDAGFIVHELLTPVEECVKRNLKRGEIIPTDAIWKMYRNYVEPNIKKIPYNPSLPDAVVFDLDGTLAHMKGRSPYEWSRVGEDTLDENVAHILDAFKLSGRKIIILSGRDAVCREETERWLDDNRVYFDTLIMRGVGDSRKDTIVKEELYLNHIKNNYNVLAIFDDRDSVVGMWRSLGLKCCQVNEGSF